MNKNNYKKTFSFLLANILILAPLLKTDFVFAQNQTIDTTGGVQVISGPPNTRNINSYNTGLGSNSNNSNFNFDSSFNYNTAAGNNINTSGSLMYNPGATGSTFDQSGSVVRDPTFGGALPAATGPARTSAAADGLSEAFTCSIGAILAGALTNLIGVGASQITNSVVSLRVPILDVDMSSKEVGLTINGIPIFPGWDAIAYCLGNAVIVTIADSTIAWIQSGFEGQPVFVDDPTKLFQDIADYELETFLGTLGGGFLCQPFESYVTLGLVDSYTQTYSTQAKCTLDQVQGNIDSFLNGDSFNYDMWFAVTQNPANNPYGSYLMAQGEAQNRIGASIGQVQLELDWGNGFLPWKAQSGPNAGKTITTGQMIEAQLQETLGLAPERLVLAEKFDQVINELVKQLVKTALNETFEAIR